MSYGDRDEGVTEAAEPVRAETLGALSRVRQGPQPGDSRNHIETSLDRSREAASRLEELLVDLQHRIGPVLGPERPEPALGQVRDGQDVSVLAERLSEHADRLTYLGDTVQRLIGRVEL